MSPRESSKSKESGSLSSCMTEVIITLLLATMVVLLAMSFTALGAAKARRLSPSGLPIEGGCRVNQAFPEKVLQWCELITRYSDEGGLEPDLVAGLIWLESGGNPQAYSRDGAVGLMQVMPRDGLASKFVCKGIPCFAARPTIEELQDPEYNVQYGTQMLANLLEDHQGDLREALKDYGPVGVGYSYADTILDIFERYRPH